MQLEALSKVHWGKGGENDFTLLEGSWQEEWRVVPFSIGRFALPLVLSKDGQWAEPVRERTTGDHREGADEALARCGTWFLPPGCPHSFSLRREVGIFQFTLTPRIAPLWEGWGWMVTRVKGRTDWQPEKKHKSLSTKPPTGSKQDGRVAVSQDPLGSHVT